MPRGYAPTYQLGVCTNRRAALLRTREPHQFIDCRRHLVPPFAIIPQEVFSIIKRFEIVEFFVFQTARL